MTRTRRHRPASLLLLLTLVAAVTAKVLFPGPRLSMALTIATGLGRAGMQRRIDTLEAKAINGTPFTEDDKDFLVHFYSTLSTGAKLSVLVKQTGQLMDHYLARSGDDFQLDPIIFTSNRKVQRQAERLRKKVSKTACERGASFSSGQFYMPDPSSVDSVFGLYHGTLRLSLTLTPYGTCLLQWRAEVPWIWPSYTQLKRKYGNPHAESFPLPNIQSLIRGREYSLFVDNGLGHHLEVLGLAKSFIAYAEWQEEVSAQSAEH